MKPFWLLLGLLTVSTAGAQPVPLRRLALLIATNEGGDNRVPLRYAVSDARNLARVLVELGGVRPSDAVILEQADRAAVRRGLSQLQQQLFQARASGQRTEVILYYSGHSDEQGLLLGAEKFPFLELRSALESLPADVRVAILDSCASGALARRKGGSRRPAFLLDTSTQVRGQAILTSSSADEASQESDGIGASYFTHHLISGLRGAADASRDGKVTLSEAYQFAFKETLSRTESTQAGAQHPVYDIDLAGSGELVLTDVRTHEAGLHLSSELEGRLFIRDATGSLVAELHKRSGDGLEMGLAAGRYTVFRQLGERLSRAEVSVLAGARATVAVGQFVPVAAHPTVRRGAGVQKWWINVGLVPFVSTNDLSDLPVENHLSLAVVATRGASLSGVGLAGAAQWVERKLVGAQLAGAFNGAGSATGVQLSGAAQWVAEELVGAQLAGAFNRAGRVGGVQMGGAANYAGQLVGAQLAGAFNHAGEGKGAQLAGAVNSAGRWAGAQLGIVNIGGELKGLQLGVINIGSRVNGLQLGLINIGGEVQGESVGLVSVVRNGQFHLEALTSDIAPVQLQVKLGSRRVYSVFGGARLYPAEGRDEQWSVSLGLGVHLAAEHLFLDADLLTHSLYHSSWESQNRLLHQLRVMGGYRFSSGLSLLAGPSLNVSHAIGERRPPQLSPFPTQQVGRAAVWPGLLAGVRY